MQVVLTLATRKMQVTNFNNYGTYNEVEAGATQINNYYGGTGRKEGLEVALPVLLAGAQQQEEKAPEKLSLEVMGRAIKAVQGLFWGKSSYAVIFCAVRDFYGHADNGSLFEEEVAGLYREMGLDYDCPVNTIASSFYNNSYLKLPIRKWEENNVKPRSLQLVREFTNAVEQQIAKK